MATFERVHLDDRDWQEPLSTFQNRIVFQTPAWAP